MTNFDKSLKILIQNFLSETMSVNGQNEFLKEKITFLEREIENLHKINALIRGKRNSEKTSCRHCA